MEKEGAQQGSGEQPGSSTVPQFRGVQGRDGWEGATGSSRGLFRDCPAGNHCQALCESTGPGVEVEGDFTFSLDTPASLGPGGRLGLTRGVPPGTLIGACLQGQLSGTAKPRISLLQSPNAHSPSPQGLVQLGHLNHPA